MKVSNNWKIKLTQAEAMALFTLLDDSYDHASGDVICDVLGGNERGMMGTLRDYLESEILKTGG